MGKRDSVLQLADGRRLGYAEYGDLAGGSILYFHGMPGSRWDILPEMAGAAKQKGLRLIVPERPGYGLSDPDPGRSLYSWTEDVSQLMDLLEVSHAGVISFSGGGAYGLSCAIHMTERIDSLTLVAPVASLDGDMQWMGMAPEIAAFYDLARDDFASFATTLIPLIQAPENLIAAMEAAMPESDRILMRRFGKEFTRTFTEGFRRGGDGMATDFAIAVRPWSLALDRIHLPVQIWHGTEDRNAPFAMGEYLAAKLPASTLNALPGQGHLIAFSHWETILSDLKSK